MSKTNQEPLLQEDNRYVMFPVSDQTIWKMYKKQIDCFWRPEEIDTSKDMSHWDKMTPDEVVDYALQVNHLIFHKIIKAG
jgi:ribonucleotide reductase beta subunit family protein with ferritin-like domain